MNETTNVYSSLSDQTKFWLNVINKIKDYFNSEVKKKWIKRIAAFDYFGLSETSGVVSKYFFTNIIGVPVERASASFSLLFSFTTGIINKLLKITRNEKRNNKIVMLAKSKSNRIEIVISQAVIDLEFSHEE